MYGILSPQTAPREDRIVVNDAALTRHLMLRDASIGPDSAAKTIKSLSREKRGLLVEQLIREEVLYREARALGLEQFDYSGRRRLITQLEYINRGFFEQSLSVSEEDLSAYYEANRDRYATPANITFTHIYINSSQHGSAALSLAQTLRDKLDAEAVPFSSAPAMGDRFLYGRNYVEREQELVASHFGDSFARTVFTLDPSDHWVGPIESHHGLHFVLVTSKTARRLPPFAQARSRVLADVTAARVATETEEYYLQARGNYEIILDLSASAP